MIGRLVRSKDFERVLRTRSRASSTHFAVHHVPDKPSLPAKPARTASSADLSTAADPLVAMPVDDSAGAGRSLAEMAPLDSVWLGAVVPKRHARRAVTRTLLKRQIRAVVTAQPAPLAAGLWVVRLRAPFDRQQFVSAASDDLKRTARDELTQLFLTAAQRLVAR